MAEATPLTSPDAARAKLDSTVEASRRELLRYCTRMAGSAMDGEDIVQEAIAKAYASADAEEIANPRQWLFRIAHNHAIDFLRRRGRLRFEEIDDDLTAADPDTPLETKEMASMALSLFLQLTPLQRSAVFLKDVMGHSLQEICELHQAGLTAVKAALHRGRTRLRELAGAMGNDGPPALDPVETARLASYVERFSARDFDAVRALLAEDVRLDLVGRVKKQGRAEVGQYFTNYSRIDDWRCAAGIVDGVPAILVLDAENPGAPPQYFIRIEWKDGQITSIRDYRYARHVTAEAEVTRI